MANEITLPVEVSDELIANALKTSYIMGNAKKVALSQRGEFISYLNDDAAALFREQEVVLNHRQQKT